MIVKTITHEGKDYDVRVIDGELVVSEAGTYYNIPLTDKPKLAEMAANAVGQGQVDMAPNAGPRLTRAKVLRRWMDQWKNKKS